MTEPIDNINNFEKKIYSQNGEDGIIEAIFNKIGTTNKYFVEFGVKEGTECNTRLLREKEWDGLWMDNDGYGNLLTKKEFITAENINELFKKYNVPENFDLLSIDIDFNDYWVWKAIEGYFPRVVIIEYNASILPTQSLTVKYEPTRMFDETNYFGASLLAYAKLADKKGYTLVGCDNNGVNAFFVKKEVVKDNFILKSVEELYRPPQYGIMISGKYIGHKPSNEKMIDMN